MSETQKSKFIEESSKPRRRWFRFSLRMMLVLVTLVCVLCGYLGWAISWISQRRDFLSQAGVHSIVGFVAKVPAPMSLRILGEEGTAIIILSDDLPSESKGQAQRLFPEADVDFTNLDADMPDD